jgi:hypothetical protein
MDQVVHMLLHEAKAVVWKTWNSESAKINIQIKILSPSVCI